MAIFIESNNVKYTENYIEACYKYETQQVRQSGNKIQVLPETNTINIRTHRHVPKLGVMLVGWGGNNGSTITAALLANKLGLSWRTKNGTQNANWFGSITQSSTIRLGSTPSGSDMFVPLHSLLPMVSPNDLVLDGWDISGLNLFESMKRARVLDPELQEQLKDLMSGLTPRAAPFDKDFVAANQEDRATNIIAGTKQQQFDQICADIDDFKSTSGVEKIIVLWTANTERFCEIIEGVNDTPENLKKAIKNNHPEISPSILFACASILKKCTYINGSPQNTFIPAVVKMAEINQVFIAGDDFKSGQTKIKSVLVDFLISAGIKPVSIVSYNHLGNNDGKNLSAAKQFKSKEISKSNVVDDMVQSNKILYKEGEKPDHCVVIKYVPYVGDTKRAMDEYTSELMLGGLNTLVLHNTCEDSLLASPIILDLVLLAELCSRIEFKNMENKYQLMHPVLSILSYLCKAPLVPEKTPIINSLFQQRACIENILRACLGLQPNNHMYLEHKLPFMMKNFKVEEENFEVITNGDH